MAISPNLIDKVKNALRINSADAGINTEISDSIEACKKELEEVGVVNIIETDSLIIRSAILHAKADFDFCGKGEQFKSSFNELKCALSMAQNYNTSTQSTDSEGE